MQIVYNAVNGNGRRLNDLMRSMQALDAEFRELSDLVNAVGVDNLEGNDEFGIAQGNGVAFNDSFLQIANSWATFFGDGSGGTVREKVSRFAR